MKMASFGFLRLATILTVISALACRVCVCVCVCVHGEIHCKQSEMTMISLDRYPGLFYIYVLLSAYLEYFVLFGFILQQFFSHVEMGTGPLSTVGSESDCCRSRGCKFDPGTTLYFHGD